MSDSPEQLPDSLADDRIDESAVEHLPQRALVDDEPAGASAFRSRIRRFALPGVLTLSVLAGLALAGVTGPRPDDSSIAAAPAAATAAPAAPPEARTADTTSRDQSRTAIDVPTPEASPSEGVSPEGQQPAPRPAEAPLMKVSTLPPSPTSKPTVAGTRYATATVNVRAEASADSDKIGSVAEGDAVSITGKTASGFSQILLDSKTGWVSSEYLSSSKPSASAKPSAPASSSQSRSSTPSKSSSSSSSGKTASGNGPAAPAPAPAGSGSCKPVAGLQASTARVQQAVCAKFPGAADSYGGVRPDNVDYRHPAGLALDVMISNSSSGWQIAEWAKANAGSYGISQVIYQQKIWTTQRSSEGWRSMSDRGSATANHMDHVHISIGGS